MRLVAPLGLLLLYALACGLAAEGPGGPAVFTGGIALGIALTAAGLGYGLGRLRSRDPVAGWALTRGAALWTMGIAAALALFTGLPGLAVPVPLAAGYLAARRSLHASDALLLGVVAALAFGVPFHREAWEAMPLALAPALLVAAALGLRETWDVGLLDDAARARQSPLRDGSEPAPGQRNAVALAQASAWVLVAAAAGVAVLAALARQSAGAWEGGSAALLVVLAAAGLAGAAWLARRA